jgi:hypothetical protein
MSHAPLPGPRVVRALLVAVTAGVVALAGAEPSAVAVHRPPGGTRVLFTFDNGETLRPGTVVRDASGHRHAGRVMVRRQASLRTGPGWFHRGAVYPGRCDGCGRAIIEVPDGRGLDPRRATFVFGAAVRVTARQARLGSNVVQKGYFNQAGGQYKLQLLAGGAPSCVVNGGLGRVIVRATKSVADRRWHRLGCTRTPHAVQLRVDGKLRASARGRTGWVGNDAPIRVGGKKVEPANKQYHGDVDSVFVRVVSRD